LSGANQRDSGNAIRSAGERQPNAKFIVPSGLPKLPDFTLYHAAVVFQSNGQIRAVTNPVTLRLRN
jgi:hypothetical protein